MGEINLLDYYKKIKGQKITLTFEGIFSQDILVSMAKMLKNKIYQEIGKSNVAKRVFSIFIEMAQNISRHSAEKLSLYGKDKEIGAGIIVVSEYADFYIITSGNLVEKGKIAKLIERCDYISQMDDDRLKRFYKDRIKQPRGDNNYGGDIGLIDNARKSDNAFKYEIHSINDRHSLFVLSVNIQKRSKFGNLD